MLKKLFTKFMNPVKEESVTSTSSDYRECGGMFTTYSLSVRENKYRQTWGKRCVKGLTEAPVVNKA